MTKYTYIPRWDMPNADVVFKDNFEKKAKDIVHLIDVYHIDFERRRKKLATTVIDIWEFVVKTVLICTYLH